MATALLPTLAWGNLTNAYVWVAMVSTLTFGMVGFLDDYLNVVRKPPHRLRPWYKLTAQGLVTVGVGFLWYNSHPAKLFMGEVGALALGGALGAVAILLKPALLLPIVGAVFVIELFSVVIVDDTLQALRVLTRYLRQRSDIHKESGRKPLPTEASDTAAHIHRIETDGSLDSAIGLSVSPLTRRDELVPLSTASQRGDRRQQRRVQIIRTNVRKSQDTTTVQSDFFPSLGEIVDATAERVRTVEARFHQQQIHRLTRGVILIDDSSTANPATVGTALSTLSTDTQSGRRVAVLGGMLELGEQTLELHRSTGRAAAVAGLGMLVTVGGASARTLGLTAVEAGLPSPGVIHCETSEEAAARVSTLLQDDDLVLVKGSRQVRTELVVLRLIKEWA